MSYIKESVLKLKKDALSKMLYDSVKYLFITFIGVIILSYIPVVKEIFLTQITVSIWSIVSNGLLLIVLSFLLASYQFHKKFKKLQTINQTDELTGLKNYKAKDADLLQLKVEKNVENEPISLILIDIDDFKKFNEENSYKIADQLLIKLGHILDKDSRITDETYRYFMRGDEFLIIAKQTTLTDAKLASERKRKLIQDATFDIDGSDFKLTVSCGVTELNFNENQELAFDRLNKALLNAKKKSGKNSTEVMV